MTTLNRRRPPPSPIMAALQTVPTVAAELLRALGVAFVFGRFLLPRMEKGFGTNFTANSPSSSLRGETTKTLGFFFLFVASRVWLALVDKYVPEPYLVSSGSYSSYLRAVH